MFSSIHSMFDLMLPMLPMLPNTLKTFKAPPKSLQSFKLLFHPIYIPPISHISAYAFRSSLIHAGKFINFINHVDWYLFRLFLPLTKKAAFVKASFAEIPFTRFINNPLSRRRGSKGWFGTCNLEVYSRRLRWYWWNYPDYNPTEIHSHNNMFTLLSPTVERNESGIFFRFSAQNFSNNLHKATKRFSSTCFPSGGVHFEHTPPPRFSEVELLFILRSFSSLENFPTLTLDVYISRSCFVCFSTKDWR
jgi:hypothetical protein